MDEEIVADVAPAFTAWSDDEEIDENVGRRPAEPTFEPDARVEKAATDRSLLYRIVQLTRAAVREAGKFVRDQSTFMYDMFVQDAPAAKPYSAGKGAHSAQLTEWLKSATVSSMARVEDYASARHQNTLIPSVFGPLPLADYEPPAIYPIASTSYAMKGEPVATRGTRFEQGVGLSRGQAFEKRVINVYSSDAIDEIFAHAVASGNLKKVMVTPAHLQGEPPKEVWMSMLRSVATGKPQININFASCPRAYTEALLYSFTDIDETGMEPNHLIRRALSGKPYLFSGRATYVADYREQFGCEPDPEEIDQQGFLSDIRHVPTAVLDRWRQEQGRAILSSGEKLDILYEHLDGLSPLHKWVWIAEHRFAIRSVEEADPATGKKTRVRGTLTDKDMILPITSQLSEMQFKVQVSYLVWRWEHKIQVTRRNGSVRTACARFPARFDLSHKAPLFENPSIMSGYEQGWQLEVALAERVNMNISRNACTALMLACLIRRSDGQYEYIRPQRANVSSACPHTYDPCWGPVLVCIADPDEPTVTLPAVQSVGKEPPGTGLKRRPAGEAGPSGGGGRGRGRGRAK